jgi:hypothetical protein
MQEAWHVHSRQQACAVCCEVSGLAQWPPGASVKQPVLPVGVLQHLVRGAGGVLKG